MTASQTLKNKSASLLKNIKSRSAKLHEIETQRDIVKCYISLEVYLWVTTVTAMEPKLKILSSFGRLADEVGRSRHWANRNYYTGLFMKTHKFDLESTTHRLASMARNCENKMTPPDFKKVLKAIRDNEHPAILSQLISKGYDESEETLVKTIRKMKANGEWNKTGMKRLLKNNLALLSEYFWDESLHLVLRSDADNLDLFKL